MADQTTRIKDNDSTSRVAYDMALRIWMTSNGGHSAKMEDREEFLNLVRECVRALQG